MITSIREVRRAKGLTLDDVARACVPPTTAQTIGRLEMGTRTVSVAWLNRIAAALGVEAADLVRLPGSQRPAGGGGAERRHGGRAASCQRGDRPASMGMVAITVRGCDGRLSRRRPALVRDADARPVRAGDEPRRAGADAGRRLPVRPAGRVPRRRCCRRTKASARSSPRPGWRCPSGWSARSRRAASRSSAAGSATTPAPPPRSSAPGSAAIRSTRYSRCAT